MTPWRHEGGRQSAYSCGGSHGLVCNKRTVFPFNSFLKKERNRRSRLNGLHTRQSSAKSGVEPKPLLYSDRLCGLFSRRIASIVSGKDSAMINIHRRTAALITLLAPFAASAAAAQTAPHKMPDMGAGTRRDMTKVPWMGSEEIAMLVYPGMTVMDLIDLHCMFGSLMGAKIHIVAKSLAPVTSDAGLTIVPDATFETCPRDLTVLFTPGGTDGTLAAANDPEPLAFMADRGARAKYVTSVCSGSLILGATGLLKGYKATSHWSCRDALAGFGAIPSHRSMPGR